MGRVIKIGDLNQRVILQYPTKASDGMGNSVLTWANAAVVWAKIYTSRSEESVQAMASTGIAIHSVVIRYRTDIRSSWRIQYGNTNYAIIGPPIDIDRAHKFLDIKCKETA